MQAPDRTTFPLRSFDVDELRVVADSIATFGGLESPEATAQALVTYLRDTLVDEDGAPACPLVRLYKTQSYASLDPDLRAFARGLLDADPEPSLRCLTLLGTAGELPEWNDRALSRGHRAIPLPSEEVVLRLPMVAQLITQLGLDVGAVVAPPAGAELIPLSQQLNNVFHVEHAAGSPYLPAQEEFVVPYGIASAAGFGGMMLTGDFFAIVLFSRVPIAANVARTLKILALPTRTLFLPFVSRR